jgi:formylglycine-generating enzyme required for sulfatase activity
LVSDVALEPSEEFADLKGSRSCDFRMVRGGDWADPPAQIRSACRNFGPPPPYTLDGFRSGGIGFRVARDLSH